MLLGFPIPVVIPSKQTGLPQTAFIQSTVEPGRRAARQWTKSGGSRNVLPSMRRESLRDLLRSLRRKTRRDRSRARIPSARLGRRNSIRGTSASRRSTRF